MPRGWDPKKLEALRNIRHERRKKRNKRMKLLQQNRVSNSNVESRTKRFRPLSLHKCTDPLSSFLRRKPDNIKEKFNFEEGAARVHRHRFSPSFAVTYNKVQGMTLRDGVVLSLKRHTHARLGSISIEKFFVGISRAKSIKRIAILPCDDVDTELHYLTELEFSAEKRYWFQNYIESEGGGSSWNENARFILPEIEKKINAVRKKGLKKASRDDLVEIAKQAGYKYGAGTSHDELGKIYNEVFKRLGDGLLYDFSTIST